MNRIWKKVTILMTESDAKAMEQFAKLSEQMSNNLGNESWAALEMKWTMDYLCSYSPNWDLALRELVHKRMVYFKREGRLNRC